MIETALAFLVGWIFIPIIIIGIILIIYFHETENNIGWSHTVFILIALLVAYKYGYTLNYIKANPLIITQYIGAYIGIGVIWAFCKWFFHLKSLVSKYNEIKLKAQNEWTERNEHQKTQSTFNDLLKNYVNSTFNYRSGFRIENKYDYSTSSKTPSETQYKVITPQASENKKLITTWISHWPISVFWTLLNDPIKKLINYIFENISHLFQNMSNRIFKNVKTDFNTKE